MKHSSYLETLIGVSVISAVIVFVYHMNNLRNLATYKSGAHVYYAKFTNIEGIHVGTEVKIGGLTIGSVFHTALDQYDYRVGVKVKINNDVKIPADSVLAVSSSGLLGGKYLEIKPGMSEEFLVPENSFESTISAVSLEELISKFAFNGSHK